MAESSKTKFTRPVVIGLVGGIASGKSYVAGLLQARGALRIDADRIGHQVLQLPEVRKRLTDLWGSSVLSSSGELDREQVAKIVFGNSAEAIEQRSKLEAIVHPRIRSAAFERIAAARAQPTPPLAIIIDAPLLLEAGWEPMCDLILFVDAPLEERVIRAATRGWTAEQLADREASQLTLNEKRKRATHILDNSRLGNIALQVNHLWEQLERCTQP